MKVLVTGGAGFVGSHLAEALVKRGHTVTVLDNFMTGRRENLTTFEADFVEHDLVHPFELEADAIYHLACPASPVHYQHDPVYTAKIGFLGTLNCLELARKNKARFLLASTSEIYGDPDVHPQVEDYCGNVNPVGPRACYDESKRISETLTYDFQRMHDLDVRVARIFNTYGPRMRADDGRVVSNFIVQALKGESLTIYGDGSQTRSFCYVSDLVEGLIRLMEGDYTQPVNLGNPGEFTIKQLADLVLAQTSSSVELTFHELPKDDPKKRRPDITRASEHLGWMPAVPLEEGLAKTVEYFRTLS